MPMEPDRLYDLYRSSAGVTTDSRSLRAGEIFFALRGPTHDGNRHAPAALEAGALAAVVDDPSLSGDRYIVVESVLETLSSLARHHRRTLDVPVIAITGSNGKTTTRELVTAVLARKGRVHSTAGNLNNHIGVPLTILSASDDIEFMIVEMGANHKGEIASLCETAMPTHGIITNIGTAHIEGFGSLEDVKKAKSELYRWLGRSGGTAIYNDSNAVLATLVTLAGRYEPYSAPAGRSLRADVAGGGGLTLRVTASVGKSSFEFETGLFGSYNIDNVRAAMATGILFDVPEQDIVDAITSYRPANNRSQIVDTGRNIIICDAYNANPSSMEKAIASFAALMSEKKMVILGDMLELGSESEKGHASVVRLLDSLGNAEILLAGPQFRHAAAGSRAELFGTSEEIAEWLRLKRPRGYTVLVKGSRGMMMEKVFPRL